MAKIATSDLVGAFLAGVLATACMSGVNTAVRRVKNPAGGGALPAPAHYEKIGERLVQLATGDDDRTLDDDTRVRFGEALHFAFGGVMGSAFLVVTERLAVPAPLRGTVHGLVLWAAAFAGYFPAMKAHPGVWQWDRVELAATLRAHLVYGNSVMLLVRGWKARRA